MFVSELECVLADCCRHTNKAAPYCISVPSFYGLLFLHELIVAGMLILRVIIAACQCQHVAHVLDSACTGYAVN